MKKIVFTIISILILYNTSVFSQNKKAIDSLSIYEINNNDFKLVLDSFIVNEMMYKYYDSTVMFSATIDTLQGITAIQLFSGDEPRFEILDNEEHLQVFFIHNNHYFIATSRSNYFDEGLFKKTNKKQAVKVITTDEWLKEQSKKEKAGDYSDSVDEEIFATDWIYNYYKGNMYFVRKSKSTYKLKEVKK